MRDYAPIRPEPLRWPRVSRSLAGLLILAALICLVQAARAGGGEPQQHQLPPMILPEPPMPALPELAQEAPALEVSLTVGDLPWELIAGMLGLAGGGGMLLKSRRKSE